MKFSAFVILIATLFITLSMSNAVFASGNYHVEVIVFDNINSETKASSFSNQPPATLPSNGEIWNASTAYLNNYASRLRNSSFYNVLQHTAWGQTSAGYNSSAAKQLSSNGMAGSIKVYATSLLFAQLDINFRGHRIKESRRLKLNEVHYFDNTSFGILLRVSRAKPG